jgi:hypothetical protein
MTEAGRRPMQTHQQKRAAEKYIQIKLIPKDKPYADAPAEAYGRLFMWLEKPEGMDEQTMVACAIASMSETFGMDPFDVVRDHAFETKQWTGYTIDLQYERTRPRQDPYIIAAMKPDWPDVVEIREMLEAEAGSAPKP